MSEPLRRHAPDSHFVLVDDPLANLMPPVLPAEDNDNDHAAAAREGERVGFEVPRAIWGAMLACYATFLALLLAATGGGYATFSIAISAIYVAMFFGTAKTLLRQGPPQPRSPLASYGGKLATFYGPLSRAEVAAQMLVVPVAIVLFGAAILIIRLAVF